MRGGRAKLRPSLSFVPRVCGRPPPPVSCGMLALIVLVGTGLLRPLPVDRPARAVALPKAVVGASVSLAPLAALAEEAADIDYGSVNAPNFILPLGALLAILTALLPVLLRAGDDAAKEMQERDRDTFGKVKSRGGPRLRALAHGRRASPATHLPGVRGLGRRQPQAQVRRPPRLGVAESHQRPRRGPWRVAEGRVGRHQCWQTLRWGRDVPPSNLAGRFAWTDHGVEHCTSRLCSGQRPGRRVIHVQSGRPWARGAWRRGWSDFKTGVLWPGRRPVADQ